MKTIVRKTLLYQSRVESADFCINHIEGCAHGCRFPCYAMLMKKRYGIIKDYKDWIEPKIVANTLELLEREIPKYRQKIKSVHLCFSTDPFMYQYPEVSNLSLTIIERLNKNNIPCMVLTKGIYPEEITEYSRDNQYGITLVSLDEDFRRRYEPYAAGYKDRIKALNRLHRLGLKTWVCMEPYPTPNLVKQDLRKILEEIAFVDKIIFEKLNYSSLSSQFSGSKDFYEDCADVVTQFFGNNGIECNVKSGTQPKNNKEIRNTLPYNRGGTWKENTLYPQKMSGRSQKINTRQLSLLGKRQRGYSNLLQRPRKAPLF